LFAGVLAFAITLWLMLAHHHVNLLDAVLRAVGAGVAVIGCALLITGILVKLGGQSPGHHGQ